MFCRYLSISFSSCISFMNSGLLFQSLTAWGRVWLKTDSWGIVVWTSYNDSSTRKREKHSSLLRSSGTLRNTAISPLPSARPLAMPHKRSETADGSKISSSRLLDSAAVCRLSSAKEQRELLEHEILGLLWKGKTAQVVWILWDLRSRARVPK